MVGRTLSLDHIARQDIVGSLSNPRGQRRGPVKPIADEQLLHRSVVDRVLRKGKQLAIGSLCDRWLIVRLGMSGQLLTGSAASERCDHVHARWTIGGGASLAFRDARRFGSLIPCPSRSELEAHWQRLGPDALSIDPMDLLDRLRSRKLAVKAGLLNQQIVAGVGNIYADESLFRARIHPRTVCTSFRHEHAVRLAESLREVLASAIEHGGSTLRDYCSPSGITGSFRLVHQVYGREGQCCLICGAKLSGARVGGRATVWCPTCQGRRIK